MAVKMATRHKGVGGASDLGQFSFLANTASEVLPASSVDGTVSIGFNRCVATAATNAAAKVPQNGFAYFSSGQATTIRSGGGDAASADTHLTYGINEYSGVDVFGSGTSTGGTVTQAEYTSTWGYTGDVADLVFGVGSAITAGAEINETVTFGSGGPTLAIIWVPPLLNTSPPFAPISTNVTSVKFDGVEAEFIRLATGTDGAYAVKIIDTRDGDPLVTTVTGNSSNFNWRGHYISLA